MPKIAAECSRKASLEPLLILRPICGKKQRISTLGWTTFWGPVPKLRLDSLGKAVAIRRKQRCLAGDFFK
jgi:hypothetical protein